MFVSVHSLLRRRCAWPASNASQQPSCSQREVSSIITGSAACKLSHWTGRAQTHKSMAVNFAACFIPVSVRFCSRTSTRFETAARAARAGLKTLGHMHHGVVILLLFILSCPSPSVTPSSCNCHCLQACSAPRALPGSARPAASDTCSTLAASSAQSVEQRAHGRGPQGCSWC